MLLDSTINTSRQDDQTEKQGLNQALKPGQRNLSSIWSGRDANVESTFVNNEDGKLGKLWIAALSEAGKERFVYCNVGRDGDFNTIPSQVAEDLSYIYQGVVRRDCTLTESMSDIGDAMEDALWRGFWASGVGDDMFSLPEGLKTRRPIALMPEFQEFCANPTLGRNLFAVAGDGMNIAVFIDEARDMSLIAFNEAVYRVPGTAIPAQSLRDFTFSKANMLVDGLAEDFTRDMEPYLVIKTWRQAGGPSVMLVEPNEDGGASLSRF